MSFSVTVQPSGHTFAVEPHETVLAAALRQGVGLPYGCRNGACGTCKGQLVSGRIVHDAHQSSALSAEEEARGFALFCSAHPETDIVIEAREVRGIGDIPIRKMPCRVARVDHPAPDVAVVTLQLPANERFQYVAGQYIDLLLKDGKRRSYSLALAPHRADQLEIHIRHLPGGLFTDHVFAVSGTGLKVRDILRFEGPFGSFTLREDSDKPMVFLASGTGYAPIRAILETVAAQGTTRTVTLYWGGRRPRDLYRMEEAAQIGASLPGFRFVPVISDALPEDAWDGRTGFVHRAVLEDFSDLSGYQVYACGAPVMVEAARRDFTQTAGLPEAEFYADAFTTEADLAKPSTSGA